MNTTRATNSRKGGIVAAIGLLVLLLGTATGNAYMMLAMAISALAIIAIVYRGKLGRGAMLAITAATATAITVAFAIAWVLQNG
jgi:O-antigen ligase